MRLRNVAAMRLAVVTAVMLTLSVLASCGQNREDLTRGQRMPKQECPHYWGVDSGGPLTRDSLSIPGPQTNQPEYNDCQRFIDSARSAGGKYLDIQAIFARYHIDSAYAAAPALIIPAASPATPFAPLVIATLGVGPAKVVSKTLHLLVIGEVYSEGQYLPLGLHRGYNCLVLAWDKRVTPVTYAAWMVSVASDPECGKDPLSLDPAAATLLNVTALPTSVGPLGPDTVPPVARWDWDDSAHEHYIGLSCPTGWCDFHHDARYTPSASYAAPSDLTGPAGQLVRQKGWYDEQYLAETVSPGPPPTVRPGLVLGTVFPVQGLASRKMNFYKGTGWQPVGWVSLSAASTAYKNKYNYDLSPAVAPKSARNRIEMCFLGHGRDSGDSAGCNPSDSSMRLPTNCRDDAKNGGKWFARTISQSGQEKVFCILYRPSPDNSQPPGVVRWRWTLKDETIWISCPTGCCEMDAIF